MRASRKRGASATAEVCFSRGCFKCSPIMKALVTGGAGFIGSELTRQLVATVDHVTVVDNLVNGRRENLDGLHERSMDLEIEDIRNSARMAELLEGIDVVFHLACLGVRH